MTALLSMIAALRTFSVDKLQFWRESASGINRTAFFLAKDVVDLFNVGLKPLIYLSMFYFLSTPRSTFLDNYIVTLVLVYCVTGISYIIAILFEPVPAQLVSFLSLLSLLERKGSQDIWVKYFFCVCVCIFVSHWNSCNFLTLGTILTWKIRKLRKLVLVQWSVFLPILATLIVTSKHTGFLLQLSYLSYARYALEAYVIANAKMWVPSSSLLFPTGFQPPSSSPLKSGFFPKP